MRYMLSKLYQEKVFFGFFVNQGGKGEKIHRVE